MKTCQFCGHEGQDVGAREFSHTTATVTCCWDDAACDDRLAAPRNSQEGATSNAT